MSVIEQILLGIGGLVVVFFFWPGAKAMLEKSRQAENPDWNSVLVPIIVVVIFIAFLVMIVSS